ncbi:MAG: glutathione S-transferase family protein, partial [Steroidobacteraceae bacterium]
NYSSWSLRPWVLLRELNIDFAEHMVPFGDAPSWQAYRRISPSGKVPCLLDGGTVVWDSLAIAEYLAERHPTVWPAEAPARAWARSAAAEMHSGFMQLRTSCSMCCAVRVRLHEYLPALERDVARLAQLWNESLRRFGGPFLGGARFTAVDAFYAPVAFRIQTYGLRLDDTAAAYAARLLELPSMQAWYTDALAERTRDTEHEQETLQAGTVLQDLRRP